MVLPWPLYTECSSHSVDPGIRLLAAGTIVDMDDVFDLGTREMNGRVPKVHGLSSILGGLWELQ